MNSSANVHFFPVNFILGFQDAILLIRDMDGSCLNHPPSVHLDTGLDSVKIQVALDDVLVETVVELVIVVNWTFSPPVKRCMRPPADAEGKLSRGCGFCAVLACTNISAYVF